MITPYLFVYGTLRKDLNNEFSKLLETNGEFIGKGILKGILYDIGEYPAAVRDKSKREISGEVFKLKNVDKVLEKLDLYEDYNPDDEEKSEYVRSLENIYLMDGRQLKAWVYWYNLSVENKSMIKEGDYFKYLENKD